MPSTASFWTIINAVYDSSSAALRMNLSYDHTHSSGSGSGGQLDWDVIWSDAVHSHGTDTEGGQLDHGSAFTSASLLDDDHPQYQKESLFTAVGDMTYASGSASWVRLPIGNINQVLLTGSNGTPTWGANPGYTDVQTFTTNGTWAKPTGITYALVDVCGGGGGGAGGSTTNSYGGGGGGGGARSIRIFTASLLGSNEVVTVGSSVAGGSSDFSGAMGLASSFGTHLYAQGGGSGVGPGQAGGGVGASIGSSQTTGTSPESGGLGVPSNGTSEYGGGGGGNRASVGGKSVYGGGGGGGGGGTGGAGVGGGVGNWGTGGGTGAAGFSIYLGEGGTGGAANNNGQAGGTPSGGGGGGGYNGVGGSGARGEIRVWSW